VNQVEWGRVWEAFSSASVLPPEERRAFLESLLPEGPLRDKTWELLAAEFDENEPPTWNSIEGPAPSLPDHEWRLLGKFVSRFEILAPIGRGGMGEVYRARDSELNRQVAIKCIAPWRLGAASALSGGLQEARAASALNHPGIVTVYEVIRTEDSVAIVMELVEGTPLRKLTGTPQPIEQIAIWGARIAEALAASHAGGIIHRDIKPENLILRHDAYVKILDFGLATDRTAAVETLPVGTVRYMSPEQGRAAPLTPATDIFSLGLVLYELAAGAHPFVSAHHNNSTGLITEAIATHRAPPPSSIVRGLPAAFDSLIAEMLDRNPAARPTAEAVAQRLTALPRTRKVRDRRAIVAAVVVAMLLAGLMILRFTRGHSGEITGALLTGVPGRESEPSFSPDGGRIAYTSDGGAGGSRQIYVKALGKADPVRLTQTPEDKWGPAWSPNGATLAFLRQEEGAHGVVIVPAGGGPEREVTRLEPGRAKRMSWLNNGELVVLDSSADDPGMQLFRVSVQSGSRAPLLPAHEKGAGTDHDPLVSPNGNWIAFVRFLDTAMELRVAPSSGGDSSLLAKVSEVQGIAWTHDSRQIYYYPSRFLGLNEIWQVAPTGGAPVRAPIYFPMGSQALALSPDGRYAAYEERTHDTNVWQIFSGVQSPRKLVASPRGDSDGAWSPDGSRIAFVSDRTGPSEIWMASADGSGQGKLTSLGGSCGSPAWSPDGRRLAFDCNLDGQTRAWTVEADGGTPKPLLDNSYDAWVPNWSHDGRWIYFCSHKNGREQIWKAPSEGGIATPVTQNGFESRESPDGAYLYFSRGGKPDIWRISLRTPGAREEKFADLEPHTQQRCWDVGNAGVYVAQTTGPRLRIEVLPFSGGPPEFAAFLPAHLPVDGRCLSVDSRGQSFLYPILDADRQEIYLAKIGGW
jgi:Tol biopolymer transport system component